MTVETPPEGADRRSQRRMRALKGAKIVFNHGYSVFDCTARNLSASGALIEVASTVGIPAQFEIIMDQGGMRRNCTVRWRTQRTMGVHFDDTAENAA